MSRSLGDFISKSIGCICTPGNKFIFYDFLEIVEENIEKESKFMVIASDGIFEVLDNLVVENCILQCYLDQKYETSAGVLVEKAVLQWRRESNGQDDITAIIVFFD